MTSKLLLTSLAASALLASPVLAATPGATTSTPPAAVSTATPAAPARAMQTASSSHKADNAALYRAAQEKLHQLNLYNGDINGRRNAAYVSALRRFQREHHLTVSGRLDGRTRQALGIT